MKSTKACLELKKINWSQVDWQNELSNNINSVEKLKEYVDLSQEEES